MQHTYKYDVAISFAEEDRNIALAIALALEIAGIKNVYYYPHKYEETWGLSLKEKLSSIYHSEAKYAVVLLSKMYKIKLLAQVELESIKARMAKEPAIAYMMPVIAGELPAGYFTELLEKGYFTWVYNPKEIAASLSKLLGVNYAETRGIRHLLVEGSYFNQADIHFGDSVFGDIKNTSGSDTTVRNSVFNNPKGAIHFGNTYTK